MDTQLDNSNRTTKLTDAPVSRTCAADAACEVSGGAESGAEGRVRCSALLGDVCWFDTYKIICVTLTEQEGWTVIFENGTKAKNIDQNTAIKLVQYLHDKR